MKYLLAFFLTFIFAAGAATSQADGPDEPLAEAAIEIQYDTDDPSGRSRVNVTVSGVDASSPKLSSITLSPNARPGRPGTVQLRQSDDGSYIGSGMAPAPGAIQSFSLNFEEIKVTYRVDGLTEGEADADVMIQPEGAQAKRGKRKVKVKVRCCPLVVIVQTGITDAADIEGF